ncbi:DUF669 domain-containing protein [Desulfarculus baarsii]
MYLGADLNDVQDIQFDPVPPGDYVVRITDSRVGQAKSSGNAMAEFELEIEGPSHVGRKLWDRFVLGHEVGMSRLKNLATAAGHPNPSYIRDTEELHGLRALARVKIEEDKTGQYDPKNKIGVYKPLNGAPIASGPRPAMAPPAGHPAAQAAPTPPAPSAAPAGGPPWSGARGPAQQAPMQQQTPTQATAPWAR